MEMILAIVWSDNSGLVIKYDFFNKIKTKVNTS